MIPAGHAAAIRAATGAEVVRSSGVGGGCITDSRVLSLSNGQRVFYKTASQGMFAAEARGLGELARAGALRVPEVVCVGANFLVLEHIPTGRQEPGFFQDFGERFATLHRFFGSTFGFVEDNWCGATPQVNTPTCDDWATFYWDNRLLFQLRLAERSGQATRELSRAVERLEARLPDLLEGAEEPPSLLHGDLWGGNFMVDDVGQAVLVDPAVYYGHREADLAMTRLFGGFSQAFYAAYQEAWPLPDGWEEPGRVGGARGPVPALPRAQPPEPVRAGLPGAGVEPGQEVRLAWEDSSHVVRADLWLPRG
jgi:fructosamine-3-kinase